LNAPGDVLNVIAESPNSGINPFPQSTPKVIAQAEDTPPPPPQLCCIWGTEEDIDPLYPSTVPFGLDGKMYPTTVTLNMACINPTEGLTANQWGEKLGFTVSITGRGLFWYDGWVNDIPNDPHEGDCEGNLSEEYRHRPDLLFTGWTTNIPSPVVPGTYWIKGHFQAEVLYPSTNCDYSFTTIYKQATSYVKIMPDVASGLFDDSDNDGLSDYQEADYSSLSMTNPFTFMDGVLDSVRVKTNIAINSSDFDGDGLNCSQEAAKGSSVFHADSDGDGVNDGTDDYPLDSSRSSSGVSSSDSTPPTVSISSPL